MNTLKEIYAYREMIRSLVKKGLRSRYKASVLGFMWTFLNPLLQLIVYTFVFSVIMRSGIEKYYIHLFVALVPWLFFSTSLANGASCIIAQKDLVKKIYFPRQVLPIAHVLTCFVNMLLTFVVVFVAVAVAGIGINLATICYLPIIMFVEFLLALGFALLTSALTVYFRDLEYILGIITMAWQFLTPIMYSIDMVPEDIQYIFYLNPMTAIIIAYRDILYYKQVPELSTLLSAIILGVVVLGIGCVVFDKLQKHFAEEL